MNTWTDKVVCVAGGSRGFGCEIARAFHHLGAKVVLLARDEQKLRSAVEPFNQIRADSGHVVTADLSDDQQRSSAVRSIIESHRKIDVWVNAVGQSIRSDFASAGMEDYRRLMEQNFFVSVGCSLEVLPHLENSSGHLVNIGSLAAKTSWRYLAPYVTSKHALAGFAKQLRLEGPANVHYLFVCPGPIKSNDNESSGGRYAEQTTDLPSSATKPGAGAPVSAIDPMVLAEQVVQCCQQKKIELIVPWKSRLLFTISQMFPNWGDKLVRRMSK